MLIGAKTAKPCSIVGEIQHPVYRSHFDSPIVLLQASPGCLHPESLAGVLQERQREVIWLRFGAEDRDPANCLLSLVGAFGRFEPQAVEAARLLIHREPGPLYGWPRLYSGLAAGVRSAIQSPVTLVLQNTHLLGSPMPSLRLLGEHFLPHLPGNLQVVLTATATLALHAPSRPATWISEKELLLDEITTRRFFQQAGIELSSRALQRLMHLTQGKAGALSCLRRMCEQLGELYLNEIILNKRHFSQAMLQYVQDSLESMDRASVEALSVLASLGYDHPDFRPAETDHPVNPDGAWATSLEGGWLALQSLSRSPLQHTLKQQQLFHTGILQTTVDYLCQNQAYEEGVRLLLQSGSPAQAAERIVEHLPRLLNNGQWSLLENWLDDLPESIKISQPWLAHARGEIAAARGNLSQAAQAFTQARNGFTVQDNPEGLWLTWIALYTLAVWRSDLPGAWSCARQALNAAPSPWQVSWTEYLIGQLSLNRGDAVAAAAHLARAVEMAENGSVREHIRKIETLAQRQGEIENQRMQQRQTLQALDQEHAQVQSNLDSLLSHLPGSRPGPADLAAIAADRPAAHTLPVRNQPARLDAADSAAEAGCYVPAHAQSPALSRA